MNESIKRFEISNFKKFDHLAVENIGQINLITGDNNVGKTCLLEALVLEGDIKLNISYLIHFLYSRGFLIDEKTKYNISDIDNNKKNNIVGLFQKEINKPIVFKLYKNNSVQEYKIYNEIIDIVNSEDSKIKNFAKELEKYPEINSLSKNWILFYSGEELKYMVDITSKYYQQFLSSANYVPLVTLNDFFRDDLIGIYNIAVNSLESKKAFIDTLNHVFPTDKIIDIQTRVLFGKDQLTVATSRNSNFHSITQYGSGFVRVIRVILEIMTGSSKCLMIDEIDTGVHFLKMKDLWVTIFRLVKQMGIQIFASTHSSDCIKALMEAAEEYSEIKSGLRLIELEEFRSKSNVLVNKATTYEFEPLKFKLQTETNVRGGNVWQ